MKTRIHVSLEVSDLARSRAFYERLFGHEATKVQPGYTNFRLDQPALHLALVETPAATPRPRGSQHFGVELFDDADLASWRAKAEGAGLELRIEDEVTCCYAVANKFWAKDPDGHEWEFWHRQAEADSMHGERAATAAAACGTPDSTCCAPTETTTTAAPAANCCAPAETSAAPTKTSNCCAPQRARA